MLKVEDCDFFNFFDDVTKKAFEIKSPLIQKESKTKEEKEEPKDYSE